MAVGVPENDVFAAADAVLTRGERPTVERVRQELGRGSPARVGGLLDQWWARLAERLKGETRLPELPAEVSQAFVAIWEQAVSTAHAVAEEALDEQRQVLALERLRVAGAEDDARQECARYRQQTMDAHALQVAAESRLADLERLLEQQQLQIDDLTQQREALKTERDVGQENLIALQLHQRAVQEDFEQERKAQVTYVRGVEDRAHGEVDRAREEAKVANMQMKQTSKLVEKLQQDAQRTAIQLHDAQRQATANKALADVVSAEMEQLQAKLVSTERELGLALQSAVAQQARADALEEQLKRLSQTALQKRRKASVKTPVGKV